MEEVVLGVQLLVVVTEPTALFTKLIDGLLHLLSFELWQSGTAWRENIVCVRRPLHVISFELEELVLERVVFFSCGLQFGFLIRKLVS